MKHLSEQLADLSVRAKSAEEAVEASQKEAHEKIVVRREQAHAAATVAVEKVDKEIKSVNDTATRNWSAMRVKVSADMTALKTRIAKVEHDQQVKHIEKHADELEWEAGYAIDYAVAAVEQANLAVFDAIEARSAADSSKQA